MSDDHTAKPVLSELTRMQALILVTKLNEIETTSKDSLATHAVNYRRALDAYRAAVSKEWRAAAAEKRSINMDAYDDEYRRFEVSSALYAPGLIAALSNIVLQARELPNG